VTVANGNHLGPDPVGGLRRHDHLVNNAYPGRKYMLSVIDSIHWLGVSLSRRHYRRDGSVMKRRPRIEGYAVSRRKDDRDSDGLFPEEIKNPADHKFYMDAVAAASAVANGAHSAEGGPNEKDRKRLRLTRQVTRLMPDPKNANVTLWNPATAPFDEAWAHLRIDGGTLAVVGGGGIMERRPVRGTGVLCCQA